MNQPKLEGHPCAVLLQDGHWNMQESIAVSKATFDSAPLTQWERVASRWCDGVAERLEHGRLDVFDFNCLY